MSPGADDHQTMREYARAHPVATTYRPQTLAAVDGQGPPAWSQEPGRFLTRWWFPAEERAFIPLALVESPAAFRRRGIFIAASLLSRV